MLNFPPNFAQVVPGLYRSGSPGLYLSEHERRALAQALKLKTVVRLAGEEDDARWPSGVHATSLPGVRPVMTQAMMDRWAALLQDKSNWPILAHCRMGAERTGVYIAHAEILLGVDKARVQSRLQKHGEGLWRQPEDRADLGHLKESLSSLARTGRVLSDKKIASYLGWDAFALDEQLNAHAEWSP